MPSPISALPLILLLHAYATHAAPLIGVSPNPLDLSRRDDQRYLLGFALEDPCATLQILRDENDGCGPTLEFIFFNRLLQRFCDNKGAGRRSLLGSNFKFFNKHGFSKEDDLDDLGDLGKGLGRREDYDESVDGAFPGGEVERSSRRSEGGSTDVETRVSNGLVVGNKHRRRYRRDRLADNESYGLRHGGSNGIEIL